MKIYLYYLVPAGLEPVFYAFTADKERDKLFREFRKGLLRVEKNVTKEEYLKIKTETPKKEIIPHILQGKEGGVNQLCTENEIMTIMFKGTDLIVNELSKYLLPIDIFEEDIQHALSVLGYEMVRIYSEETLSFADINISEFGFDIDEVSVFTILYGNTLENRF